MTAVSTHREGWPISYGSYVRGCRCDGCKAKQRAYYEQNREEIAAKQRAYREQNREEIAAKQRAALAQLQQCLADALDNADHIAVERLIDIVRAGGCVRRGDAHPDDRLAAAVRLAEIGASTSTLNRLGVPGYQAAEIVRLHRVAS